MGKTNGGSSVGGRRRGGVDFAARTAAARAANPVRRGSVRGYLRSTNNPNNYNTRFNLTDRQLRQIRRSGFSATSERVQRRAASRRTRARRLASGQMSMFDF